MSTPTPSSQRLIAPHLRESVFRDYEGFLSVFIQSWPSEVGIEVPANRAVSTFVANLRNAILSARQYDWPSALDLRKLRSMHGTFIIRLEDDGKVWIRHRTKPAPSKIVSFPGAAAPAPGLVPWRDPTQEEIEALCLLIHYGRLTGPFILDGAVGAEQLESLSGQYNVGIVYDETKNQTIIT